MAIRSPLGGVQGAPVVDVQAFKDESERALMTLNLLVDNFVSTGTPLKVTYNVTINDRGVPWIEMTVA